jgi:hypothetical protein
MDILAEAEPVAANVDRHLNAAKEWRAHAGGFDLRLPHDEVVMPVPRHRGVFERAALGPRRKRAQADLAAFVQKRNFRAASSSRCDHVRVTSWRRAG